jgi:Uma2 family endonuclease
MPAYDHSLLTADDLLRIDIPDKWTELDQGRLVVREPPGTWHGIVSASLACIVGDFVRRNRLGVLCGQDTGFKIASGPDTVRAPDLAYIARDQMAAIDRWGYAALIPDLVAEVVSPSDRLGEVRTRAGMWIDAGVRLVWVIDPDRAEARVHRPDGSVTVVAKDGMLDGEAVLPGFSCALADVLSVDDVS